ncbi:sigma-70 family RNA polymerase sigma factor family protein [Actinacidiphila alni]|uniref:hypothetical protein n=1 Tax=Actinacidiphila alni TaxID=380248 RepID=UPI0011604C89|nr:hypothetical protein [Actinacidiphila alni]
MTRGSGDLGQRGRQQAVRGPVVRHQADQRDARRGRGEGGDGDTGGLGADGGGFTPAALTPVRGAATVAALLARADRPDRLISPVRLNGAPAARVEGDGYLAAVSLSVEHGRVTRVQVVANPHKLTRLDAPSDLAR